MFAWENSGFSLDASVRIAICRPQLRVYFQHLGEPLEPPPVSPARGPPTEWAELVQMHDDREAVQGRIDQLPAIDIHSL